MWPLFQEINLAILYLPCTGGGFLLYLFTGISALRVYFFALLFFSGEGSVFHQPLLLSVCYEGSLYFFVFVIFSVLQSS
jgi:hypothetical protein